MVIYNGHVIGEGGLNSKEDSFTLPWNVEALINSELDRLQPEVTSIPFSPLDLLRQCKLNLSRYSNDQLSSDLVKQEIHVAACSIFRARAETYPLLKNVAPLNIDLDHSRIAHVDESLADLIHESYHYLGSPRKESMHLGLYAREFGISRESLAAVGTFSRFDLSHMSDSLPAKISGDQVLVLSRFFAFHGSPRNTVSFAMSRMLRYVSEQSPHVKLILSYLNPNLGFTGASYRASNWSLFGIERKERYLFLDGRYVTDREMVSSYGTAKYDILKKHLGDRLERSKGLLKPLHVYAYYLDRSLRRKCIHVSPSDFTPNRKFV